MSAKCETSREGERRKGQASSLFHSPFQLPLCITSKLSYAVEPGFHQRRKHRHKHKSAYFTAEKTPIQVKAQAQTQGSKFSLFLCFSLCCVKMQHSITTRPSQPVTSGQLKYSFQLSLVYARSFAEHQDSGRLTFMKLLPK